MKKIWMTIWSFLFLFLFLNGSLFAEEGTIPEIETDDVTLIFRPDVILSALPIREAAESPVGSFFLDKMRSRCGEKWENDRKKDPVTAKAFSALFGNESPDKTVLPDDIYRFLKNHVKLMSVGFSFCRSSEENVTRTVNGGQISDDAKDSDVKDDHSEAHDKTPSDHDSSCASSVSPNVILISVLDCPVLTEPSFRDLLNQKPEISIETEEDGIVLYRFPNGDDPDLFVGEGVIGGGDSLRVLAVGFPKEAVLSLLNREKTAPILPDSFRAEDETLARITVSSGFFQRISNELPLSNSDDPEQKPNPVAIFLRDHVSSIQMAVARNASPDEDGLSVCLEITTDTPEATNHLKDALTGFLALGKITAESLSKETPDMLTAISLLQSCHIEGGDRTVTVSATLSREILTDGMQIILRQWSKSREENKTSHE